MYIKVLAKISKIVVDIVCAGCYIYHDRRSTTVIATAAVATTVVIFGRR